eukprot:25492-Eustigmatos_ZCMA.PRE.1
MFIAPCSPLCISSWCRDVQWPVQLADGSLATQGVRAIGCGAYHSMLVMAVDFEVRSHAPALTAVHRLNIGRRRCVSTVCGLPQASSYLLYGRRCSPGV